MSDFVICIQSIESVASKDNNPELLPQKGKVYELINVVNVDEFPGENFLDLVEFKDFIWHSDFFRPVNKDEIAPFLKFLTERAEVDAV